MTEPIEDISMKLWAACERDLATREIALVLAEMIFKNIFGEEDFEKQLPLQVSETPDRWIIEGSRTYDYSNPETIHNLVPGKNEIEISKASRILKLIQPVSIAWP